MDEPTTIETARLVLRPVVIEDAAAVAAIGNDLAVARTLFFLPHPFTEADARAWIEGTAPSTSLRFAARRRADGRLVGIAGVHPDAAGGAEIGYWLGRADWGRGYATEMARAVAGFAAEERGFDPLWAVVMPDNAASIRVLEKLGFVPDGSGERPHRLRGGPAAFNRYRRARPPPASGGAPE